MSDAGRSEQATRGDARALARDLLSRRGGGSPGASGASASAPGASDTAVLPRVASGAAVSARRSDWTLSSHPEIVAAMARKQMLADGLVEAGGVPNPYYAPHTGTNGAEIDVFGEHMINFSAYNYLGLAGDPRVIEASKQAIDTYGTSCSATRIVSGQIPLHAQFEAMVAQAYGVDDAIVTGSGYLTNAAVIGFVLGPDDVAVCDGLIHNSLVAGTQWAHCKRLSFRHNDPEALRSILKRVRGSFQRALVVLEGVYSMDGDIGALPELVAVAREYECITLVDEAHSIGVLGRTGWGATQHFGLPGVDVDIWMCSISKALASHGGYLAGSADFVEALRMVAPGIALYAGSSSPAATAAAMTAWQIMTDEPERVARVRANAEYLAAGLARLGVDIGLAGGSAIVPAILGDTRRTMLAAQALLAAGVNANPIMYPAVPEDECRVRFFLNSEHTTEQLDHTLGAMAGFIDRFGLTGPV